MALQQTAGKAISDAYAGLKTLIQRRFANQPEAQTALVHYEDNPRNYEQLLKKHLDTTQLDRGAEIVAAAHHLLALMQEANTPHNHVTNQGMIQGLVNENIGTISMSFHDPKAE